MDFGASDAIELVNCLGKGTWNQARYSLCFDSLVEELDQQKTKLENNIEVLNEKVKECQENTVKVGKRLELDLKESKDVINKVDELAKKVKPKKTCCHGPCPDLIWQYRLGRQVANKTETMKQINVQFQPQKLSRIQSLPGMGYYFSEDFIPFKSAKKASDELLKALKDPLIRRIGLYGMGGIGKTTLVKVVGNEAQELFEKVVFVPVSSTLKVRNIQGSIADELKLPLKEENEPERAKRLYMRLSGGEKILIILDDVWEELNFEAIGIPFSDNHNGCRILLTTRLRGVCVSLKCHKMVRLDLLSEKEAWQLFKKHAGINDDASEKSLKGLPQAINKACKGLPVAIAAIASSLKDKTLEEWKGSRDLLKQYEQLDIDNNSKDPYACLRLSYDHLKKKEAQDLFLLCSLFPEDSEIKEEDLIRMGTGLGLFENVYTCNSARTKGRATIRKLVDSFLLLQAKEGMSVMLHDIFRAVALKIAEKKIQTILEPTVRPSLMELPERVSTEEITKLYCHNVNEFPLHFKCPKLEILIVSKDGKGSPEVPDEFLNEMGRLKVLTIIDKTSWQNSTLMLPKSIWTFKCLRTLCIRGCRLDFIFSLQQLQHLETLEFRSCSILQLPEDLAELKKLILLDVSRCRVRGNPYKVLGNCPKLEELYFSEIDLDEEELKDQNLAEFFGKNDYLTKLERYNVQVGARVDKLKDDLKSGFLSIRPYSDQDTSTSTRAIKDLVQRAELLFLENIPKSCENVIPDMVYQEGGSMTDLIELLLRDSNGIKYLIDTTNPFNQIGKVFSKLHKLRIARMDSMEGFCYGAPPCGLFEQLKELECSQLPVLSSLGKPKLCSLVILTLEGCPMLESLFTPAVALSLVLLEELKITKCHGLKYIIGDDKEEDITDEIDQKTYGSVFTKLKELVVGDCSKLEYLFPISFAWGLENLEILKIYLAPKLKCAFRKHNHTHQSCYQNQTVPQSLNLPDLKVLELLNLDEIISICPENYIPKFPDVLESRMVNKCPKLIISTNAPKVDSEIEVHVQQDDEPPRKAKLFFWPSGTSTVAENIKECVYAPILRQARYSLSFTRYVEDLRTEKETLKFTSFSLRDRAHKENLVIDGDVKKWLVNADILIEEAEKLEEKAIASGNCCLGRFPNWIQRYRIGKRAERKIAAMIKHNQSREFQKFSQRATFPPMEDYFQEYFIFFDSRKSLYYSLLESLIEDKVSIIGLYGMGGVGKTELAKQVGKEAEQLFDRVVFVVVSSNHNVRNIQENIAAQLGLPLWGEHELETAKSLFMRLANGERILIILDDVWERLSLEGIGIPFGVNRKGCSVLITTRIKQVCIMMDCQRIFLLSELTEEEAWTLFRKHAHITEETNDSVKIEAIKVIHECRGLPIAIAVVASALKGKPLVEWQEALKQMRSPMEIEEGRGSLREHFCHDNLKDEREETLEKQTLQSSMGIEEGLESIYKSLLVSYYNLADENAKSFFLLCSVFPEDLEIHEEYLMRYVIVLSLFGEVSSYEVARNQVSAAKKELIDTSFLLEVDKGQCVKMHHLIRDLTLLVANKEIVTMEGIHDWHSRNTTSLRYLWLDNVDEFPHELDFPSLEFLYLGVLKNSNLTDEFFKGMERLRVLILHRKSDNFDKPNLPLAKSILYLPNLVGLFIEGWELDDISFVVSLKRLEALVLCSCSFQELPDEITELKKLRLLDLSECIIERNPYEAIRRCSQLQELYFTRNSRSEQRYRGHDGAAFFQENETALKLERYRIEIGHTFAAFQKGDFSTSRGLYIEYFDASTSNTTVKNLVQRAEVLSLEKIYGGCENIIPGMVQKIGDGISELVELHLISSEDIKCITNSTGHVGAFFPRLTKLRIRRLGHMVALFYGPTPAGSFEKLTKLRLYDCPMLKYLFTVAVAQSLEMLQVMKITNCDSLKHIIRDVEDEIITNDDDQKSISAFPKLELLAVKGCRELEYLGGPWLFNLCSLKKLIVEHCPKLKSFFTESTAKTMTSLEELTVEKCYRLTEVFAVPSGEAGQALRLPRLKMLRFIELPELVEVSHGFKLQHVINAVLKGCPNFRGPVDGFQNFSRGENPVEKEIRELDSESDEEEEDVIWQSTERSQESGEIHVAQAGTSNINNTASSSGEVYAVDGRSTNISKEDRDVTQTSLNQDVAPLAAANQEYQTQAIKASSSSEATAVQRNSSNITKEDRDATPQNSPTQDANLNEEDQGNSSKKEMGSILNLQTHHGENVDNGDGHSGTAIEEPTIQTLEEPVKAHGTLEIDQNVDGINFRKGEDSQTQEFDASGNPANASKEPSKESVEQLHISEKYSVATSLLEGKESDSQIATNQDVILSAPLAATNPEHQTPEEGVNQKKMEYMDVQNTTLTGISLPVYNQIGKDIKSDKLSKPEITTGVGGQFQERETPIGSQQLIESIGETTIGTAQMGLPSEKSMVENSSPLELAKKASNKEPISMDHQEEAFEEKKDTATLELPSSVPVPQSVDITTPVHIQAPIEALVSSVALAPIDIIPTHEVSLTMSSTTVKLVKEEYAPFRDIAAIKKKHIPLLEQAISNYPSLWAWHGKPRHPQMKQFGYIMLGNMLEFLASTKWRDLNEEKRAEFESLLDGLETFGFDTQWLENTCAMIKQSRTINRMHMLELQAMALESELQKTKLELDGMRVELEKKTHISFSYNFNNFIGF